ncbi:MAG: biotin--[acetyl-CoA-carboxylase] ligase [Deltaproteobacteria bacterium]|nr:MAG: biotin--[acetyl-CoA-carboxylase] ligase [Deltaproteobacteria bacterium]
MKGKILEQLRKTDSVVSGEILSAALGLSRVSIWKHIQGLKERGYEIDATARGYRLVKSPDIPYAWEFPERCYRIHYVGQVDSTMKLARKMARKGAPAFTIVVADTQTQGRGRMKRVWRSEKGGLYFTLIIRPAVALIHSARINLYAAIILAGTLNKMFSIDARVKWPNDILVQEKKLAGLLTEMEAESDQVVFMNIGIGINVNNNPTPHEPSAVTLKKLMGHPVSRIELLSSFLDDFTAGFSMATSHEVIDRWKQSTVTLNRPVEVVTPRDVTRGVAVDIDENGGLMIQQPDGTIKTVVYGDCFHQELPGVAMNTGTGHKCSP